MGEIFNTLACVDVVNSAESVLFSAEQTTDYLDEGEHLIEFTQTWTPPTTTGGTEVTFVATVDHALPIFRKPAPCNPKLGCQLIMSHVFIPFVTTHQL